MYSISYPVVNHVLDAKFSCKQLDGKWMNGYYEVPKNYGKGIVEAYDYNNYSVMISAFNFKKDLRVERISSDIRNSLIFGYILNGTTSRFVVKSNGKLGRLNYGANITSPITASFGLFKKDIWHRQVSILVKTEWLKNFWKIDFPEKINFFNNPLFITLEMSVEMAKSLRLIFEGNHLSQFRKKKIELKCKESLIHMQELISEGKLANQKKHHPDDLNTVLCVAAYLKDNFSEIPSINVIAQEFNINKDKLFSIFKSVYGTTIARYVKEIRLEKAYELLVQGFTVFEVGTAIGFTNLSYFARIFKEAYGINPSEIQKMSSNKRLID